MAASTNSAPSSSAFGSGPVAGPSTIGRSPQAAFGSSPTISHPRLGQAAGVAPSPLRGPFDVEMDDHTGSSPNREYSQPPPAWPALNNNGTPSANSLGKRKGLDDLISGPLPGSGSSRTKFRTLGGSVAREDVQEVELRAAAAGGGSSTFSLAAGLLPVPPIKSILKASVDDSPSADWIEARNSLSCECLGDPLSVYANRRLINSFLCSRRRGFSALAVTGPMGRLPSLAGRISRCDKLFRGVRLRGRLAPHLHRPWPEIILDNPARLGRLFHEH